MEVALGPATVTERARSGGLAPKEPAVSNLWCLVLEGAGEQETIDEAVRAAAAALNVDLAHYLELHPETNTLWWRSVLGWPLHMIGTKTPGAGSFAGSALAAGGPVVLDDTGAQCFPKPQAPPLDVPIEKGAAALVRGRLGEPLGVLACYSRDQRPWGHDEAGRLQSIADVLSVGLLRLRDTARFKALVHNSADLIAVLDCNADLTYCNPGARRLFGREPASLLGKCLWDFVHPDDLERAQKTFAEALSRPGGQLLGVFRLSTAWGGWKVLEGTATNCLHDPAVRGLVVNARDMTDKANLTRVMRTLSAGHSALIGAHDEASLLSGVCQAIVDHGGFPLAWVGYREHDEKKTVKVMASAGLVPNLPREVKVTWGDDQYGQGVVGRAIRTSTEQVIDDLDIAPEFAPWQPKTAQARLRSACAFALRQDNETIGAIAIYAEEPNAFGTEERALLAELADDLSYGIGRLQDAASLRASEERFRALASEAPIGIIETGPLGEVQFTNTRAAEILGSRLESLKQGRWLEPVCPEDLPKFLALRRDVRAGQKASVELKIRHPGGEVRHVRMTVAPKEQGASTGYIASIEDVTKEVLAHETLAYQASHDSLTGLANRASFLETLDHELAQHRRGGPRLAVLFLDIDHFKLVNDSLGHVAGDEVLHQVGERFLSGARRADSIARLSGDEFVAIAYGVRRPEDAVKAAKRFNALLAKPVTVAGQELRLTISTGIVIPGPEADAITVLRDADTAMYRAKAEGRARWAIFDSELHQRSAERLSLEAELHTALAA